MSSPSTSCRFHPSITAMSMPPISVKHNSQTMSLPKTGMVVTMDIGNLTDIHPKNKQEVGRRLALWALANDYGRDVVYSGPIYKESVFGDGKARLNFDHVGSGLATRDGQAPSHFEIAGADKVFHPATAVIDGDESDCVVRQGGRAQSGSLRVHEPGDAQLDQQRRAACQSRFARTVGETCVAVVALSRYEKPAYRRGSFASTGFSPSPESSLPASRTELAPARLGTMARRWHP